MKNDASEPQNERYVEKVINRDTVVNDTGKLRSPLVPGTIEQPVITEKATCTYV